MELTEKREEEVRNGSKGKVDGQWVEDKEEAGDRARAAALAAVSSGQYYDKLGRIPSSSGSSRRNSAENEDQSRGTIPCSKPSVLLPKPIASRTFQGFDVDDDFMSSSEDDERTTDVETSTTKANGKAKA